MPTLACRLLLDTSERNVFLQTHFVKYMGKQVLPVLRTTGMVDATCSFVRPEAKAP